MSAATRIELTLRRDRLFVVAGVAATTALAWLYLAVLADGTSMGTARLAPWTAADAMLMFAMWAVMMVAMMLPSAAPMIMLYALVCRRRVSPDAPYVPTGAFLAGYVAVWTAFSVAATVLQWGLEKMALLSPMMVSASPMFAGLVLIAAGLYQLTPYKHACLRRCRGPADFLSAHWRNGPRGAFVMGLAHGAYCLGCCWLLMALLFVGGVMNLLWVAAIAAFALVEKVGPAGRIIGHVAASALVLWGIAVLAGS